MTPILLRSTKYATVMTAIIKQKPVPSLCKSVIPLGLPVRRLINGTKILSYIGIDISVEMMMKLPRDAAGTWKLCPRDRSSVVPCLTKKVLTCAKMVVGTRVVSHIRNIAQNNLVAST